MNQKSHHAAFSLRHAPNHRQRCGQPRHLEPPAVLSPVLRHVQVHVHALEELEHNALFQALREKTTRHFQLEYRAQLVVVCVSAELDVRAGWVVMQEGVHDDLAHGFHCVEGGESVS